jgi:hypothetical protein
MLFAVSEEEQTAHAIWRPSQAKTTTSRFIQQLRLYILKYALAQERDGLLMSIPCILLSSYYKCIQKECMFRYLQQIL